MRLFLKKLWINASFSMKFLMSLISALLFSSRKVVLLQRELAKSVDISRKAFILGNGPSLKEILASPKLRTELEAGDIIVTNFFATNENFYKLKPKYYILLDPLFFDKSKINNDPSIIAMYKAFSNVDWPMILFLCKDSNITVVERFFKNPNIKIVKYNGTTIIGSIRFQNYMYKKGLGLPSSRNVILPALMLMINMGYINIYLYGAEFSWTKNIDVDPVNNKIFINDGHFYQGKNVKYMPEGWYRWYLDVINQMLFGTEQLAFYAKSRGTRVINRTKGSFIDAFEYENPDTLN